MSQFNICSTTNNENIVKLLPIHSYLVPKLSRIQEYDEAKPSPIAQQFHLPLSKPFIFHRISSPLKTAIVEWKDVQDEVSQFQNISPETQIQRGGRSSGMRKVPPIRSYEI
jgi:hypothetical protein